MHLCFIELENSFAYEVFEMKISVGKTIVMHNTLREVEEVIG